MNIYAFTALTANYPEFISFNLNENQQVELTVRGPRKEDGRCGDQVTVTMTHEELKTMVAKLYGYVLSRAI